MSSTALRNSAALSGRTAYDHIPLEKLIRDGPPDGDWDNAVECARMKVLQQEIKSDSDGMVSFSIEQSWRPATRCQSPMGGKEIENLPRHGRGSSSLLIRGALCLL